MAKNQTNNTNKTVIEFMDEQSIHLSFDELEKYRTDDDNAFPINCLINFYKACGVIDIITKTQEKLGLNTSFSPIDILTCNFDTFLKIKEFIHSNWECYSMDIKEDRKVFWKDDKWGKNKHYPRKLNKTIEGTLGMDFSNYAPNIDDELEDDVIVYRPYIKKEGVLNDATTR